MATVLPDPFYYLENFRQVLAWVSARHADLLQPEEHARIACLQALPRAAQALLVRMVMRKGDVFRHSRLAYAEIGEVGPLATLLADHDLLETDPPLALEALGALLRKDELLALFPDAAGRGMRKDALQARLAERHPEARRLGDWQAGWPDPVYRLRHPDFYDLLRLLFFGNLRQDWSEFVLTDLGLLRYEAVDIPPDARAFQSRTDVEDYLALHALRTRLEDGDAAAAVRADLPAEPYANPWLEERRARLLFQLGQQLEREKDWPAALDAYRASAWPGARVRALRVLELDGQPQAAFDGAQALLAHSPREEEGQQLARMLPRMRRALGLPKEAPEALLAPPREDFVLPLAADTRVEWALQAHLQRDDAPVFYVENALINSLFGLLCWPAIFAPVPGAFFHAFQYGPADLHHPDFAARRAGLLADCLGRLDDGRHREAILATWRAKQGRQSPFVFWEALDEALLTLALDCIPPAQLRALFTRLLADLRNNRSGFPDLVQFWPAEKRYRMLEVKGPGDRLQDNQRRWLDYCLRQGIPVAVAHVQWADAP